MVARIIAGVRPADITCSAVSPGNGFRHKRNSWLFVAPLFACCPPASLNDGMFVQHNAGHTTHALLL